MKKVNFFKAVLFLALTALFVSCSMEKETKVIANFEWEDSDYLELNTDWKACVSSGLYSISSKSLDNTPLEYKDITAGETKSVSFLVNSKGYQNYTVVVFNDKNKNGAFDSEDINYSYMFAGSDAGEDCVINFISKITY